MNIDIDKVEELRMGHLSHKLKVGSHEGGLDLMVNCYLDGEKVLRQKGRSFLATFARGLRMQMHAGRSDDNYYMGFDNTFFSAGNNDLEDVSATNPIRINDTSNSYDEVRDNDYVWIWGVRGTIGDVVNGMHRVRRVNDGFLDLYGLDNVTPRDGTGLVYGGGGRASTHGFRNDQIELDTSNKGSGLESWDLIVGSDTTPVSINDFGLQSKIIDGSVAGALNHTTTQASVQTTNKPSSRFVLTRSYTNNSGATVTVGEIGIASRSLGRWGNNFEGYITGVIARDVLTSAISIPNGSTLTVEYEVIINLEPDTQDTELDGTNGGFIDNFLTELRKEATETSTVSYRIRYLFNSASLPGSTNVQESFPLEGYRKGIRVGTDQTFTSMTDAGLLSIINHGEADGELYHYGSDVKESIDIDEVNDTATITLSRIFENRGSTNVTIKEIGLYANTNESSDNNAQFLARTALQSTDWYTVNPGAFVKISYQIEVKA